jgi:hypothetical protein
VEFKDSESKERLRKSVVEMLENTKMNEQLLSDLIYFVHHADTEKTEADFADLGNLMRNREKVKGLEMCRIHLGRCDVCRKRLQKITDTLVPLVSRKSPG